MTMQEFGGLLLPNPPARTLMSETLAGRERVSNRELTIYDVNFSDVL